MYLFFSNHWRLGNSFILSNDYRLEEQLIEIEEKSKKALAKPSQETNTQDKKGS